MFLFFFDCNVNLYPYLLSSSVLPVLFLFLKSLVLSVSLYSLEIMNFSCRPESALKKKNKKRKNMNSVFMEVDLIRFCSHCCL